MHINRRRTMPVPSNAATPDALSTLATTSVSNAASKGPVYQTAFITLLLLTLQIWAAGTSEAAGCNRGAVNCNNNTAGTKRTCTANLVCTGAIVPTWTVITANSNNVTACSPTYVYPSGATLTVALLARANVTAPPTRSCQWSWHSRAYATNGTTSIATSDGLPVELMGFSIEEDDESPAGSAAEKPIANPE